MSGRPTNPNLDEELNSAYNRITSLEKRVQKQEIELTQLRETKIHLESQLDQRAGSNFRVEEYQSDLAHKNKTINELTYSISEFQRKHLDFERQLHEIPILRNKLEYADQESLRLQGVNNALREQIAQLESSLAQKDVEVLDKNSIEGALARERKLKEKTAEQLKMLSDKLADTHVHYSRIPDMETKIGHLAGENERFVMVIETQNSTIEDLQKRLKKQSDEIIMYRGMEDDFEHLKLEQKKIERNLSQKEEEINSLHRDSQQLIEKKEFIKVLKEEIRRLVEINEDLKRAVSELQHKYGTNVNRAGWADAMEERAKQLEAELFMSRDKEIKLKERIKELENGAMSIPESQERISFLRKENNRLINELESAQGTINSLRKKIKHFEEEIQSQHSILDKLNSSEMENKRLTGVISDLQRQLSEKEKQAVLVPGLNEKLHLKEIDCARQSEMIKDLESTIRDLQTKLSEFQKRSRMFESEEQKCGQQREEIERLNHLMNDLRDKNAHLKGVTQQIPNLESKIKELENDIRLLKNREAELSKILESSRNRELAAESEAARIPWFENTIKGLETKISELEDLNKRLENALSKINQNFNSSEESRKIEASSFKDRIAELERALNEKASKARLECKNNQILENQLANAHKELEDIRKKLHSETLRGEEIPILRDEIARLQSDIDQKQGVILSMTDEIAKLKEENGALLNRCADIAPLEYNLKSLADDRDRLTRKLEEALTELKDWKRKSGQKDIQLAEMDSLLNTKALLENKLRDANNLLNEMRNDNEKLCQKLLEADSKFRSSEGGNRRIIDDLEKNKRDQERQLNEITRKLELSNELNKDLNSKLETIANQLNDQIQENRAMKAELEKFRNKAARLEDDIDRFKKNLGVQDQKSKDLEDTKQLLNNELNDLRRKLKSAEEDNSKLKKFVDENDQRNRELENENLRLKNELETIIEEADEANEKNGDFESRINEIMGKNAALIDENLGLHEKLDDLINQLNIAENANSNLRHELDEYDNRNKLLEDENNSLKGHIDDMQGKAKSIDTANLGMKKDLQGLSSENKQMKSDLKNLKDDNEALSNNNVMLKSQVDGLTDEVKDLKKEVEDCSAKCQALADENKGLRAQINDLTQKIRNLGDENGDLRNNLNSSLTKLKQAESDAKSLSKQLQDTNSRSRQDNKENNDLKGQLNGLTDICCQLESENKDLKTKIEDIVSEAQQLEIENNHLKNEIQDMNRQIGECKKKLEEAARMEEDFRICMDALDDVKKELEAAQNDNNQLKSNLGDLRREAEDWKRKYHKLLEEFEKFEEIFEDVKNQYERMRAINEDQVKDIGQKAISISKLQRELICCKVELERIVNSGNWKCD